MPRAVHRPNYLESRVFGGFAWVVPATPRSVPPPPYPMPQRLVKMTLGGAPPPLFGDRTTVFGALAESGSKG
jgi:hypothetical protein